jgi:hypothetical protein
VGVWIVVAGICLEACSLTFGFALGRYWPIVARFLASGCLVGKVFVGFALFPAFIIAVIAVIALLPVFLPSCCRGLSQPSPLLPVSSLFHAASSRSGASAALYLCFFLLLCCYISPSPFTYLLSPPLSCCSIFAIGGIGSAPFFVFLFFLFFFVLQYLPRHPLSSAPLSIFAIGGIGSASIVLALRQSAENLLGGLLLRFQGTVHNWSVSCFYCYLNVFVVFF